MLMSPKIEVKAVLIMLLLVKSAPVLPYSKNSPNFASYPHSFSAEEPSRRAAQRLTKPLIGDDGRVYACSQRTLFAFESNGTIAWTVTLNYTCNVSIAPVNGGSRKMFLVAENRVLRINLSSIGKPESAVEVFFGGEAGAEGPGEIVGLAVSISSSCVLINVKKRGLFAYRLHGEFLWSAGPVLYQHVYRQGCRRNVTGCYFNSPPVIDHCEASIYISNNEGELYSLSTRSPHFTWIQDLSSFDKIFTVTPGNNGRLYVMVPARALVLALDVTRGYILWEGSIGPLSTADYEPVVDSNGWISIGSLDGFLYSFSPTGVLKKFPRVPLLDAIIQVSPVLECSGHAVYVSQTKMEGKSSLIIGEYTHISAMKPLTAVFTMLVPATGTTYWSESYPGPFSSNLSSSDLQHFVLDEGILLAFIAATRNGNAFQCRSTRQKIASSCSQIEPKEIGIYTGNEKSILLFLLLESAILILLAAAVRFCFIFWKKKKLQTQELGKFLEKRRSLQLQKKAVDRTITELERKAAEEAVANGVLEKMENLVKEREAIERKLSTSYSLGRDEAASRSKSLLPLQDWKTRGYSFQGAKKESVTLFHTLSESDDSSSSSDEKANKNKAKAPLEMHSFTDDDIRESEYTTDDDDEIHETEYWATPSGAASSSGGYFNPLFMENSLDELEEEKMNDGGETRGRVQNGSRSIRRRTSSFSCKLG